MWVFILMYLVIAVLAFLIPVGLIIFIIRHFTKNKDSKSEGSKNRDPLRDVFLFSITMSAGIAGVTGIFLIPSTFFNVADITQSSKAMSIYLIFSMILLICGVVIKELTGKFLMVLGVILLVFSVLPFIDQFKSVGGFVVALLVFGLLVGMIVRSNKKVGNG